MRLAIFDLDGTILDTLTDMHECLMDTMRHFSLPLFDKNTTKSYVGDGIRQLVIRAAGKDSFTDDMETYFRAVYSENMTNNTRVIDDYACVLEYIKSSGITAVILSNKIASLTSELAAHYGLDAYFARNYGGDSFGVKKPSPVPVQNIMKEFSASPENTIMIGDNHTDIESGYYAGVKTCFCSFGYGNLSEVKADFVADKPEEIIKALESLK
ncbi:MAG: HAD family hydrolase [Deferribacterales bacterium]